MHPFLAYIVQWLLIPLLLCKPPWRPELPPPKASWCLFVPTCSPNPDVSEPTSVLSVPLPVPELGSRAQPRALRPALPGLRASHPRRGTRAGVRLPSGECRGPTGLDAESSFHGHPRRGADWCWVRWRSGCPPPSARAREQLLAGFTWAPCEQPPRGVASCAAELHMFSRSTCSTFFPLKEAKQPADSLGCESSSSDLRIL